MRVFVGYQHLLARWPGFLIFFYLLILDKSSLVLLFLTGRLVGASVCFCMIANFGNGFVFLAAEGGGPPVRVVVYESADDACDCI